MAFTGNFTCNAFKLGLPAKQFSFATGTTDVYKIAIYTNAATLNATTASYTAVGEVVASGYTAGGSTLVVNQVPVIGVADNVQVCYWSFANAAFNAAFTARGALIYKADGLTNPTVCVLDFGADKTSQTTFTVQFPTASATTAIIRLI